MIKKLSEKVINLIAAGEVVERPASVVKELLENSIDSGADFISVTILDGGKELIEVTDNGSGMNSDDLLLCIQRHATSKLQTEEDLMTLGSFGFRGEALSSISSVSNFFISSRQASDEVGKLLEAKSKAILPIKMNTGTTIQVKEIFSNLPAREKFLKSSSTEFRHILDIFSAYALYFSEISFKLEHNNKEVLAFDKHDTFESRCKKILAIGENKLLHINSEIPHHMLTGFISHPSESFSGGKQFLFVNGRYVSDKRISHAISRAYGSLLMRGQSPSYVLKLEMNKEMVDVNVHPRKEEVRFYNSQAIYDFFLKSISKEVEKFSPFYNHSGLEQSAQVLSDNFSPRLDNAEYSLGAGVSSRSSISSSTNYSNFSSNPSDYDFRTQNPNYESKNLPWNSSESPAPFQKNYFQLENLYILEFSEAGLTLYDQHAVHERVMYEKLLSNFDKKDKSTQFLLSPVALNLTQSENLALEESKEFLISLGYQFSNNDLIAIPVDTTIASSERAIKEYLSDFALDENFRDIDDLALRKITFLSCRLAIKQGQKLSNSEIASLMQSWQKCSHPITCPHGRPVFVSLTRSALDRMFKRVV